MNYDYELCQRALVLRGNKNCFSFLYAMGGANSIHYDVNIYTRYHYDPAVHEDHLFQRQSFHIGVTDKAHSFTGGQFIFFSNYGLHYHYNGIWFTPDDYLNSSSYKVQINYGTPSDSMNDHFQNNVTTMNKMTFWVNIDPFSETPTGDLKYIYCGNSPDFYLLQGIRNALMPYVFRDTGGEAYFNVSVSRWRKSQSNYDQYYPMLTREPQYDITV
jgi:hypothetical protein